MTNQEAITKLTNILNDDTYSWHPAHAEALEMAIDALKGADGDWISRQDAIEWCLEGLNNMPSAQPEMAIANGGNDMDKNEVMKILETAKDKNGDVPMRLVRQAFEKLPEPCKDAVSREKVFEYFVSLWECIGTIMDRDEWEDVCKTTANELPSVQPSFSQDHENDHIAEGGKMDCINRQAAIDAIGERPYVWTGCDYELGCVNQYDLDKLAIETVPSAQPEEQLTDKEQRIFLAAMGREEEVCKQVDAECRDCREPYEDSLVRTCHEIIRKVKGALWNGK